jgi:hypothetical protein
VPHNEAFLKTTLGDEMKKNLIFSLIMALTLASVGYAQAKPDFSGTWVLDTAKSDLGTNSPAAKQVPMRKVELILKQTGSQLSIERAPGEVAVYKLDGSESFNNLPGGNQATTKMTWVGDTLVGKTTSTIGEMHVEMTDVRSLDVGGKVMTLKVARQTPRGEVNQTLIYQKQ